MEDGSSGDRGGEHARRIQRLVDEAEAFAKTLDLKRNPSAHIAAALGGVPAGADRDRLFGEVRRELSKRIRAQQVKRAQEEEDRAETEEIRSKSERANMMKDAYAHQMRQPRDAWDPKADETENEE